MDMQVWYKYVDNVYIMCAHLYMYEYTKFARSDI